MRSPLFLAALIIPLAPGCIFSTYNPLFDGEDLGCRERDRANTASLDGVVYDDLVAALDEAPEGATIEICPGTYTVNLSITKDVRLKGVGAQGAVVLQGAGGDVNPGSVLYVQSGALAIENLTITGGHGTLYNNDNHFGGGIDASAATALEIVESVIENNEVNLPGTNGFGGGVMAPFEPDGDVLILDSFIRDNYARNAGGGLYIFDGQVINTELYRNSGSFGGGLAVESGNTTLTSSFVLANTARSGDGGGGAFLSASVLKSEASDWGDGDKNNVEGDVTMQTSLGITETLSNFGADETFSCDAETLDCD